MVNMLVELPSVRWGRALTRDLHCPQFEQLVEPHVHTFSQLHHLPTQVREKDLPVVVSTLEEEFNIYKEVGGESVPWSCQDASNGLQNNGKEGSAPELEMIL